MLSIKYFFGAFCLLFWSFSAYAQTTLRAQMTQINSEWQQQPNDWANTKSEVFANDNAAIQRHLELVEQLLRQKTTAHLSNKQRENRTHYLDVLHEYWQRAEFPTNTHHLQRTPYFIDEKGVACAVGFLIIASGETNLAQKIARENNYSYLVSLKEQYPAIKTWAKNNGFTTDELAWIQPCYCFAPTQCGGSNSNPTCFGRNDGCIAAPDSLFDVPIMFAIEQQSGNNWYQGMCMDNGCLAAGNYRWKITVPNGNNYYFYRSLVNPTAANITFSVTPDDGTCNGSATASPANGTIVSYQWQQTGSTMPTISNVCAGTFNLTTTDMNGCELSSTVSIPLITATAQPKQDWLHITPNPAHNTLNFKIAKPIVGYLSLYDALGKMVLHQAFDAAQSLDVSHLPKGFYSATIKADNDLFVEKIILE